MAQPTPPPMRDFLKAEHKLARQTLGEQFRSLLLEIEAFVEQVETQIRELQSDAEYKKSVPGMKRLRDSLVEFHRFAFDYFVYIHEGNPNNLNDQRLVLAKIQNEIVALRPLMDQRRVLHLPDQPHSLRLLGFLQLADKLAYDFLAKCDLVEGATFYNQLPSNTEDGKVESILVFFEEMTQIRQGRTAYQRVPSISLPVSTWRSPWLWLGLAHEIGHYVYQNLRPKYVPDDTDPRKNAFSITLQERVHDALVAKGASVHMVKMWEGWLEELFADLYGVLVLGPAYTESYICQRLLPNLKDGSRLLENDGVHPPDLLRPLVQLHLLRQRMAKYPKPQDEVLKLEVERLENLWRMACAEVTPEAYQVQFAGDGFAYWLQRTITDERVGVRRCLNEHAPIIAAVLLDTLRSYKDIKFYTGATHRGIQMLADELAAEPAGGGEPAASMRAPLPEWLANLIDEAPVWALPVAWYAWSKMSTWDPMLQSPPAATQRLLDSVRRATELVPLQPYAGQDTGLEFTFDQLLVMPAATRQSDSFVKLIDKLAKAPEDSDPNCKGCSLSAALLQITFSTQDAHECTCGPGQIWSVCGGCRNIRLPGS